MTTEIAKKVDIIRGVVTDELKIGIVGRNVELSPVNLGQKTSPGEKLLGVLFPEEVFNICFDVKLDNGTNIFGLFMGSDGGNFLFQTIKGFNKFTYNPYKFLSTNFGQSFYGTGDIIEFRKEDVIDITYQWKDIFKSVFTSGKI